MMIERLFFWEEIGVLLKEMAIPWCLAGDFNVVRNVKEKIGTHYHHAAMSQFNNFIEDIGLIDIPFSGGRFTWSSNRLVPT